MPEKKRVFIESRGLLNSFGYSEFRTPATVYLTEAQLAILAAQGVKFTIIDEPLKDKKGIRDRAKRTPHKEKEETQNNPI